MRYRIKHQTSYEAREAVSVGHNQAWLTPRALTSQIIHDAEIRIEPAPSVRTDREDAFGNHVSTFSFNKGYHRLSIEALSEVTVQPLSLPVSRSPAAIQIHAELLRHSSPADLDALQFLFDSPLVPSISAAETYARIGFDRRAPVIEAATTLMQRIHTEFEFDPHVTTVSTPIETVFSGRRGVCQDFAHVMLATLRSSGVAARYVSGYLRTYPPPGKPRLVGADASHAWVSVYCGREIGWYDLDPTNNVHPSHEHITLAWGRDYSDIPPLRGVFIGGGSPTLKVSVDVEPLSS